MGLLEALLDLRDKKWYNERYKTDSGLREIWSGSVIRMVSNMLGTLRPL